MHHHPLAEGRPQSSRTERFMLVLACMVVVVYAWIGSTDLRQVGATRPEEANYNLLVQGFRAGQLNLATAVPAGFRELADPYDPIANGPYRLALHDTSYYRGKIYLYFGVTPALVLFWPYAALTGSYLSHAQATVIFCTMGFLAGGALLLSVRRRYFPGVGAGVGGIGMLALGLANAVPVMLRRADLWEVPISCAFAFAMVALISVWQALLQERTRGGWLALASIAYGLAIGARPSVLFGGIILLVPAIWSFRTSVKRGVARWLELLRLSAAAFGPITLIGIGLLVYNYARFDSPWEFGQRYQLAGVEVSKQKLMSVDYLAFNARAYFLQPRMWSGEFPFNQGIKKLRPPAGHLGVDGAFGALVDLPILWLALAVPLVWRGRGTEVQREPLRWFIVAVALFFVACAGVLCLFAGACARYQVEMLPAFALLAAMGLFECDRRWNSRIVVRSTGGILLLVSLMICWLSGFRTGAEARTEAGNALAAAGKRAEAMREFERALQIEPDYAYAHHGLALALSGAERLPEAADHFRHAIRIMPDYAEAFNCLGVTLLRQHQPADAEREFKAALRVAPSFAEAHYGCAMAQLQLNRGREAVHHLEEALRLNPGFPGARDLLEIARRAEPAR